MTASTPVFGPDRWWHFMKNQQNFWQLIHKKELSRISAKFMQNLNRNYTKSRLAPQVMVCLGSSDRSGDEPSGEEQRWRERGRGRRRVPAPARCLEVRCSSRGRLGMTTPGSVADCEPDPVIGNADS